MFAVVGGMLFIGVAQTNHCSFGFVDEIITMITRAQAQPA